MEPSALKSLAVPLGIEPMEAKLVPELPGDPGWQFEPKWDGFRCLAFRAGPQIDLRAKSGKPLARYLPEIVTMLKGLRQAQFVVDGELAIPIDGTLSFDALQMRIHPAENRIKKLAVETPATLILFDMLLDAKGNSLIDLPLIKRRAALETFYKAAGKVEGLKLSPYTLDRKKAQAWLEERQA
ncbi:MAG TPA: ATP-dependent DNA ligase, partial [Methyloceanibacter sp.]